MQKTVNNTNLSPKKEDAILRAIIKPLITLQDPVTLIDATECARTTEHSWVLGRLMPDFQNWLNSLPDEQITWMGDDCMRLAQTIAETAFPLLSPGIYMAVQSLGTDNPKTLANGIFEYAKTKVSILEASLFSFGVVQLLQKEQYVFK